MSIFSGSTENTSLYLGDKEISSVYLGDKEVYSSGIAVPENATILMNFDGNLTDTVGGNIAVVRNNDSSATEGTAEYVSGKFGKAIHLDGTKCVQIPYNADAFGFTTEAWTVAGWFKRQESSDQYQTLISSRKRYNSSNPYSGWDVQLELSNPSEPRLESSVYYSYSARQYKLLKLDGKFPINTWTHIAMVRSGARVYTFIDGVKFSTLVLTLANVPIYNAEHPLDIGGDHNSRVTAPERVANCFTGDIDGILIVKGTALWTEDFTPPDKPYKA